MSKRFLILLAMAAGIGFAQDMQSQARTAVFDNKLNQALTLYRKLLADKPLDVDAILWVARLSAWTGNNEDAARYYDQALSLEPRNVDALVGKANLLLWQKSYRQAAVLLTEARDLAPADTDVELGWCRYFYYRGDELNAKTHLARVLDLDRENQEALRLKKTLVPDHTFELRSSFEADTLPGAPLGSIEDIGLTYRNRGGDVGMDLANLHRFGEDAIRGGLHFSRKLNGRTSVRGSLFMGSGNIAAKLDWSVGISRKLQHGWVVGADYRRITFQSATATAEIANLDYYFEKPFWIETSYAANNSDSRLTPSVVMRVNSRVRENLTLNAGYSHGTEVFQLALPEQFGSFTQADYMAGFDLAFSRKTRLGTSYKFGKRSNGTLEHVFRLEMVHTL